MQTGRVDNAILKYYAETLVGGATGTNSGSAYSADISTGNVFFIILNAATVTISFANAPASGTYCSVTFILQQDSTGGRAVVWPSNVLWPGDTAPFVNPVASKYYLYHFFTFDGGTRWLGSLAAASM